MLRWKKRNIIAPLLLSHLFHICIKYLCPGISFFFTPVTGSYLLQQLWLQTGVTWQFNGTMKHHRHVYINCYLKWNLLLFCKGKKPHGTGTKKPIPEYPTASTARHTRTNSRCISQHKTTTQNPFNSLRQGEPLRLNYYLLHNFTFIRVAAVAHSVDASAAAALLSACKVAFFLYRMFGKENRYAGGFKLFY